MEWKPTWNDPWISDVAAFDQLNGEKRTRKTCGKTVRGTRSAGSLVCQQTGFRLCEQTRRRASSLRDREPGSRLAQRAQDQQLVAR